MGEVQASPEVPGREEGYRHVTAVVICAEHLKAWFELGGEMDRQLVDHIFEESRKLADDPSSRGPCAFSSTVVSTWLSKREVDEARAWRIKREVDEAEAVCVSKGAHDD